MYFDELLNSLIVKNEMFKIFKKNLKIELLYIIF